MRDGSEKEVMFEEGPTWEEFFEALTKTAKDLPSFVTSSEINSVLQKTWEVLDVDPYETKISKDRSLSYLQIKYVEEWTKRTARYGGSQQRMTFQERLKDFTENFRNEIYSCPGSYHEKENRQVRMQECLEELKKLKNNTLLDALGVGLLKNQKVKAVDLRYVVEKLNKMPTEREYLKLSPEEALEKILKDNEVKKMPDDMEEVIKGAQKFLREDL